MKFNKTNRGFKIAEFKDQYGNLCTLQQSSLATEACIWLGPKDANPIRPVLGEGWQPVPFPEGTNFTTRMHLTQKQVADLLPALQHFVDTGYLPDG